MIPPPPTGTRVRLKRNYEDWARGCVICKGCRGYVLGTQMENGEARVGVDMNLPGTRTPDQPRVPGIVVTAAKFFDLFELSPDESVPPAPPAQSVWERLMEDDG